MHVLAELGNFTYKIDDSFIEWNGEHIYLNGKANIVYGRDYGDMMYEIDNVVLVYVTNEDGDDINLTKDEEDEIINLFIKEKSDCPYIWENVDFHVREDNAA